MKKIVFLIAAVLAAVAIFQSCVSTTEEQKEPEMDHYAQIRQYYQERRMEYMERQINICKENGVDPDDCAGLDFCLYDTAYSELDTIGNNDSVRLDIVDPSEIKRDLGDFRYFSRNNKYGVCYKNGRIVIDAEYDIISRVHCDKLRHFVVKDSLAGLLNRRGHIVLPIKYKYMLTVDKKSLTEWTLVDTCELISKFDVTTDKFINDYHTYCLKPIFKQKSRIMWYSLLRGEMGPDEVGYCLVTSNNIPVTDTFDVIYPYKSDRSLAIKDSIVGFIDTIGHFTEDINLKNINITQERHSGYNIISRGSVYGLMDENYNVVIPIKYQGLKLLDSLVIAKYQGKCGIITYDEKQVVPFIYDSLTSIDDSNDTSFIAKKGKLYGMMNISDTGFCGSIVYNDINIKYRENMSGYSTLCFDGGGYSERCSMTRVYDGMLGIEATYKGAKYIINDKGEILSKGKLCDRREGIFKNGSKYGIICCHKLFVPAKYNKIDYDYDSHNHDFTYTLTSKNGKTTEYKLPSHNCRKLRR